MEFINSGFTDHVAQLATCNSKWSCRNCRRRMEFLSGSEHYCFFFTHFGCSCRSATVYWSFQWIMVLRLFWHLLRRYQSEQNEDGRYASMRQAMGKFQHLGFLIFIFQTFLVLLFFCRCGYYSM